MRIGELKLKYPRRYLGATNGHIEIKAEPSICYIRKIQEVYFGLESFEPYIPLDICSNTYSAVENFKTL